MVKFQVQKENGELISRDSEYQFRELPAMAPLHDPVFQRDIRTIPINGTRNKCIGRLKLATQKNCHDLTPDRSHQTGFSY